MFNKIVRSMDYKMVVLIMDSWWMTYSTVYQKLKEIMVFSNGLPRANRSKSTR